MGIGVYGAALLQAPLSQCGFIEIAMERAAVALIHDPGWHQSCASNPRLPPVAFYRADECRKKRSETRAMAL